MKIIVLGALALCLAAPAVASADEAIVVHTHRHHRHHWNNDDGVIINQYGERLRHRHHGELTFYDQGRRHRSSDLVITGSVDRPYHRHHHVIVQQDDNSDSDY